MIEDMKIMVRCYGKKQEYDSKQAVKDKFIPALLCSEGNERLRYLNILTDLEEGLTYCDDRNGSI